MESLTVLVYQAGTTIPIKGARVVIEGPTPRDGQTDPAGLVTFEALAAGEYSLEVSRAGYSMANTPVRVPYNEQSPVQQDTQSFASSQNAKEVEQQGKGPDPNPPVAVPLTKTVVPPTSLRVESVTFTTDHNLVNDYDKDYKDNTGPHVRPEWTPSAVHAVSHTMDQNVTLRVKCTVGPANATQHKITLRGKVDLQIPGSTTPYTMELANSHDSTGGTDKIFELTSNKKLPREILDVNFSIGWSASYEEPGSNPKKETPLQQSPQQTVNRMFVTYGTPRPPGPRTGGDSESPVRNGFTLIRMEEATEAAQTRLLRDATGRGTASPSNRVQIQSQRIMIMASYSALPIRV